MHSTHICMLVSLTKYLMRFACNDSTSIKFGVEGICNIALLCISLAHE